MRTQRVDEPEGAEGYADLLRRVATERRLLVVRHAAADLAVVVPLDNLAMLEEAIAQQEAERLAASLDWDHLVAHSPPQEWFDRDEPKPFLKSSLS